VDLRLYLLDSVIRTLRQRRKAAGRFGKSRHKQNPQNPSTKRAALGHGQGRQKLPLKKTWTRGRGGKKGAPCSNIGKIYVTTVILEPQTEMEGDW